MSAAIRKFIRCQTLPVNRGFVRTVTTSQHKFTEADVEEIKIPVPWGYIAGKWWGDKISTPVLAIHGWQDNASSFDKLIPLLNTSSVLAIDLPGHGHSSHLPQGSAYDFAEFIIILQRIKRHFNWSQMSLLTHSFGGALGYVYSSLFPHEIKWHVNMECARSLLTLFRVGLPNKMSKDIDEYLKVEKQKKEQAPPAYKLSQMIQMCIEGSLGSITSPEAALVLLKRGIKLADYVPAAAKKPEYSFSGSDLSDFVIYEQQLAMSLPEAERESIGERYSKMLEALERIKSDAKKFCLDEESDKYYIYLRDPSIKILAFQSYSEEFITEISKNIKNPMLSIRAKGGFLYGSTRKLYEKTLSILKSNSVCLEHHDIDGTHHVHLNSPESVAPIINKFLKKYGQNSRKRWGSKSHRPILCIHGWQDNANSFNTLIPHLPPEFNYLAIDLPGHGLSSHLPKGVFYNIQGILDAIRRVQFYFKWEKMSLIGHSYGGGSVFLFASFFPSSVDFFVAIDSIKPLSRDSAKDIKNAPKTIEKMLMQDSLDKSNAPLYSKNDLIQRWIKASDNSLTEESCQILMERGTEVNDGLYKLTRDNRVKLTFTTNFTQKEYLKMAEFVTCNVLYIKAKDSHYFENKKDVLDVLHVLEKKAMHFQNHEFPGTHHIHLNTPEIIAPAINSFISAVG